MFHPKTYTQTGLDSHEFNGFDVVVVFSADYTCSQMRKSLW